MKQSDEDYLALLALKIRFEQLQHIILEHFQCLENDVRQLHWEINQLKNSVNPVDQGNLPVMREVLQ